MTGPRYDCGHTAVTPGCGGCDPAAIEYVIDDNGVLRPYDPDRDMRP